MIEDKKPKYYQVIISWGWGGGIVSTFGEKYRTVIYDKSELEQTVKEVLVNIARRYSFDCSRLDKPLHPYVSTIEVVPVYDNEYISPSELGLDKFLKNEVCHTERLIKTNDLYINHTVNLKFAPENQE
jgi:hypothetical protein